MTPYLCVHCTRMSPLTWSRNNCQRVRGHTPHIAQLTSHISHLSPPLTLHLDPSHTLRFIPHSSDQATYSEHITSVPSQLAAQTHISLLTPHILLSNNTADHSLSLLKPRVWHLTAHTSKRKTCETIVQCHFFLLHWFLVSHGTLLWSRGVIFSMCFVPATHTNTLFARNSSQLQSLCTKQSEAWVSLL